MKVEFLGNPYTLNNTQLQKGGIFPNIKILNTSFSTVSTDDILGKKVFLSLPSINSDICPLQILKFNELIKGKDIKLFAVSLDLPFSLSKWQMNNDCDVILLSDSKYKNFAKLTGTYVKKLGFLARAVFIVDENNKLVYSEYVNEIASEPNYEEAKKYL